MSDLAQGQKIETPQNLIAEAIRAKITTLDSEKIHEVQKTEFSTKTDTKITSTAFPESEIKCLNEKIDASKIQNTSKNQDTSKINFLKQNLENPQEFDHFQEETYRG